LSVKLFTVSGAEQAKGPNRQEEEETARPMIRVTVAHSPQSVLCCYVAKLKTVSQVNGVDPEGTASSQLHVTHRLVLRSLLQCCSATR
jgi:hypothetical protein